MRPFDGLVESMPICFMNLLWRMWMCNQSTKIVASWYQCSGVVRNKHNPHVSSLLKTMQSEGGGIGMVCLTDKITIVLVLACIQPIVNGFQQF